MLIKIGRVSSCQNTPVKYDGDAFLSVCGFDERRILRHWSHLSWHAGALGQTAVLTPESGGNIEETSQAPARPGGPQQATWGRVPAYAGTALLSSDDYAQGHELCHGLVVHQL